MASVIICDPGLHGHRGHFLRWDQEFVRLFARHKIPVRVASHGRFPDDSLAGAPVVRHFSTASWHTDDRQDLLKNWDKFHKLNDLMFREMMALSKGRHPGFFNASPWQGEPITRDDLVIFPSIIQFQLSGVVRWFNSLPEDVRPTVLCYLMGPSGGAFNHDRTSFGVWSFDTARFYKLAFRAAEQGAPGLEFFCCGETHAEEYSYLREKLVEPYPLLASALRPDAPLRKEPRQQVLLYAGGASPAKGMLLLPELIPEVCTAHPDWTFVVQINWEGDDIPREKLRALFEAVEGRYANLRLLFGRRSDDDYFALFDESEIVVAPYARNVYAHATSGITWEAIATANMLVVPEETWLEREAERLGAGYVSFDTLAVGPVAAAIAQAIAVPRPRVERLAVAERFKAANRVEILEQQILDRWPAGAQMALQAR